MTTRPVLSGQTIVAAVPDQVSSDLGGEAVILHLKDGTYYGLNEVGARVWSLIQQPRRVAAIVAALLGEYEVEPAECERDLLALLGDLAAHELIEVGYAPGASVP